MKIEPCAYCGGKMFSTRTGSCYCSSCLARVEEHDIETHNRLSRIVRAAEEWARERKAYGEVPMNYREAVCV